MFGLTLTRPRSDDDWWLFPGFASAGGRTIYRKKKKEKVSLPKTTPAGQDAGDSKTSPKIALRYVLRDGGSAKKYRRPARPNISRLQTRGLRGPLPCKSSNIAHLKFFQVPTCFKKVWHLWQDKWVKWFMYGSLSTIDYFNVVRIYICFRVIFGL